MQREAYFCAARSKNIVDIVLMPQGLHDEPDKLREEVQKALNNTNDIQGRPAARLRSLQQRNRRPVGENPDCSTEGP